MWLHLHVCAKVILEKKWGKLCDMKEESEWLLLEVTSFQETTTKDVTLMTLKLALEPLCYLPWSSFRMTSEHLLLWYLILWNHNNNTENTLTLALTFFFSKGHSLVNWKQSLEHQQQRSVTSVFTTTLAAVLDPLSHRDWVDDKRRAF